MGISTLINFILGIFGIKKTVSNAVDTIFGEPLNAQQKIDMENAKNKSMEEQIELDKIEATEKVQTWRTLLGYVCVVAVFFTYIAQPIIVMVASIFNKFIFIPETNSYDLIAILAGMLGVLPYDKIISIFQKNN